MLRHFQERGDRRQHVGDDLLVDRHERSPLRQLLEFFERCDVHISFSRTLEHALNVRTRRYARHEPSPGGGLHHPRLGLPPGPPLELLLGLRHQHGEPVERREARRREHP